MIESWLTLVCESIPTVERAIILRQHGKSHLCSWPESTTINNFDTGILALDDAAESVSHIRTNDGKTLIRMSLSRKGIRFATAYFLSNSNESQIPGIFQLLQWAHGWLDLLGEQNSAKGSHFEQTLSMLEKSTAQGNLQHNAFFFCSQLVDQYGFEQAVFCVIEQDRAKVKAVSKVAQVDHRLPLFFELEKLIYANHHNTDSLNSKAFDKWLERNLPNTKYLILPFKKINENFAYIVILYQSNIEKLSSFQAQIKVLLRLISPIYYKLYISEMGILTRIKIRLKLLIQTLSKPHKLAYLTTFAAAILGLALIPAPHYLSAEAEIEGKIQRAVVTPEDGYLKEVFVQAGDVIPSGAVIAKLDENAVKLEIERWQNEMLEHEREYNRQLTMMDHAQLRIVQAKIGQAKAKLEIYRQQLERTTITAPITGTIIKGDLSRAVGAPVKKGQVLFEMAPTDGHKVVLYVDEKNISSVEFGQKGKLRLSAFADKEMIFTITSVSSLYSEERNRIQYRVEAELESNQSNLRPGMRGHAKVRSNNQSLMASLVHPVYDHLRLFIWKHFQ